MPKLVNQMLQYEKKVVDLETTARKQEDQINGLTNKTITDEETTKRLLNTISGLEKKCYTPIVRHKCGKQSRRRT